MTSGVVIERDIDNPFPGLRSFSPEECHLFFGRDGLSDELLRKLAKSRLLAVVGTSGTGKSSLVRAGMLPHLFNGYFAHAGSQWRIADLRPQDDPIGYLSIALREARFLAKAVQPDVLRTCSLAIVSAANASIEAGTLKPGENVLILVDQFEELFRYKTKAPSEMADRDEKAAFVKLLLDAADGPLTSLYVVITMRSDYLGDCAQFRDLPEAINRGQYLIPRMTREQRRAAIEGPIRVSGADITPRLVQRILNEVDEDPDQLPVMQHALMRTWNAYCKRAECDSPVDTEDFEAVGALKEALSSHLDKAYKEASETVPRGGEIVKRVFQRLRERDAEGRQTRRPTPFRDLRAVAETSREDLLKVLRCFRRRRRSFLMPPEVVELGDDSKVDITHECLLREWKLLRDDWIKEEEKSAHIYTQLAQRAESNAEARVPDLIKGTQLDVLSEWWKERRPNAAWAERYYPGFTQAEAYLERSLKNRDDQRESAENRRKGEELRRIQSAEAQIRRRFALFAAAIFLVILVVSYGYKWFILKHKQEMAVIRLMSGQAALTSLEGDAQIRARVLLAAESLRRADLPDSHSTLLKALSLFPTPVPSLKFSYPVTSISASADGRFEAFAGDQPVVELRDTNSESRRSLRLAGAIRMLEFSADGRFLLTNCDRKSQLWDTASGATVVEVDHGALVNAIAVSPDGEMMAAADPTGGVGVWQFARNKKQGGRRDIVGNWKLRNCGSEVVSADVVCAPPNDIAFGPKGEYIAFDDPNRGLVIIQSPTEESTEKRIMIPVDGTVSHLLFDKSNDSNHAARLAVADAAGAVKLWDLPKTGHAPISPDLVLKHSSVVRDLAFGQRDHTLLVGSDDGTLKVWDTGQGRELARAVVDASVRSVAFVSDRILAATGESAVRQWRLPGLGQFGYIGSTYAVRTADDRAFLINRGYSDGWMWDTATGSNLGELNLGGEGGQIYSIAFSHDSRRVAATIRRARDMAVGVWRFADGNRMQNIWLKGLPKASGSLAFSPDGKYVVFSAVSNNWRDTLDYWDGDTGEPQQHLSVAQGVSMPAFDWKNESMAMGTFRGQVQRWRLSNGAEIPLPWAKHGAPVVSVAFSPDGRYLATGEGSTTPVLETADKSVKRYARIWDLDKGALLAEFPHEGDITRVTFSPDSLYLLSYCTDQNSRIFDVVAKKELVHIGSPTAVLASGFSPGGKNIFGIERSYVSSMPWRRGDLLQEVCRRLDRNLTPEEWKKYLADEPYPKPATCPALPCSAPGLDGRVAPCP